MSLKFFLLVIALYTILICPAQVPSISSFSPAGGPVGSTVVISGTNFSATPANNTVYFGPVKATVTASTSSTVSATVPAGSSFEAISVTVNNLTAVSANSFITTFGTGTSFSASQFSDPATIAAARVPCFGDFDNDGIIDMATVIDGNKILLFKNGSETDQVIFSTGLQYQSVIRPTQIIKNDFDGDGKLDLAVIGNGSEAAALHRNISTPGNIVFDNAVYVGGRAGEYPYSIDVNDIDGDGKPDIVVGYVSSGRAFSVSRNTSTPGAFSFESIRSFSFGAVPGGSGSVGGNNKVFAKDMDGDGKPDITCLSEYFPPFLIYRNTSTAGIISFAAKVSITSGRLNSSGISDFELEDMDADNKRDIVFIAADSAKLHVLKNTSAAGSFSFAPNIRIDCMPNPVFLAVNDMDGDAKPELLVRSTDSINIFKNNSIPGNILINRQLSYKPPTTGNPSVSMSVADVDGDGKGDIVLSENQQVLVLKNRVYSPVIKSVLPILAVAGEQVTIKGNGFAGISSVLFGDSAAASFNVISDSVIIAVVGNGASGNVTVTNAGGLSKYPGFSFSLPIPSINSFSPAAGPVGVSVIIKGKNFSPVLSDNIVYFGAGRATATAATDTSITVTAPAYTSYLPISVTIGSRKLSAYSKIPFNTTFDSYVTAFSNANFGDSINYATPSYPIKIATADFNGDNKADIAASIYFNYAGVSVYKNTGSNGNTAFAPRKDYATFDAIPGGNANGAVNAVATDVDGDGKPDMAATSNGADILSIFRNRGTTDSISFDDKLNFIAGLNPVNLAAADLDNDGRPDIAIANPYPSGRISVLKNISKPGLISFAPRLEFLAGSVPQEILLEDFDNDGRIDMACTNFNDGNMSLFRNISTRGTINFTDAVSKTTRAFPYGITGADLDGDGKTDVIVTNYSSKTISIFKNISTAGNILFADKVDFALSDNPAGTTVADMDGDGKPDVIAGNGNFAASISLFKNSSTAGNIILDGSVDISKITLPNTIMTTDVNGDGKPDIVTGVFNLDKIAILPNITGNPVPAAVCPFADSTVFLAGIPGTAFQWQLNTGSGFTNITNGINYAGASTSKLVLKNVPSSWYGYQYRCVVDGKNSDTRVLKITAQWLGTVSTAWENPANWGCSQLPDGNTDVIINSKTVIVNSSPTIRSLKVNPSALLTVNTGFNLTMLK